MTRIVARDSAIAEPDQPRVPADEGDVRRLDRDVRAGPDGDAEVRAGECRRVVDAVADHRDLPALGLEALDDRVLVARKHLRDHVLHGDPDLARDGLRRGAGVAGEQPHDHASGLEVPDRLGGLGLHRVRDRDEARRRTTGRNEHHGPAVRGDGSRGLQQRREVDALLLEQPAAADEDLDAVDDTAHAAADDRLEPVDLREAQLRLARLADDRLAQRVLGAGLQRRGQVQDARLVEARLTGSPSSPRAGPA